MDILSKLEDLQIAYELHSHEPFFTCEQADAVYAELEGGHSKNLFIRDRKGKQHYLIVLESYKRLDLKGLGQEMSKRFSFASPERLLKWLKVTPGSVSPLNLIFDTENHVKVLVDEDLFKHDWLYYHPGQNDKTVKISSEDLEKFLDATGNEWSKVNLPIIASE